MLTDPASIMPCVIFAAATILLLGVWSAAPGVANWIRVLALYGGLASFIFVCATGLEWALDRFARWANMDDITDPLTRQVEAIARMSHEQLECLYNVTGYVPETAQDDDLLALDDGTAVSRRAIVEISRGASGLDLRPEREYTSNQAAVRYAYDALEQNGVIEKARGRRGPRISDRPKYDLVVARAGKKG